MRAAINLGSAMRFATSTLMGLALDLGAARALVEHAGFSAPAAMAAGFLLGAVFNYAANELWVFAGSARRISAKRGLLYAGVLGCVLLTRIATVSVALWILDKPSLTWISMPLSVGLSFCVNYALSSLLFSSRPAHPAFTKDTAE